MSPWVILAGIAVACLWGTCGLVALGAAASGSKTAKSETSPKVAEPADEEEPAKSKVARPYPGEEGFLYCDGNARAPLFTTEADYDWFLKAAAGGNKAEIKRIENKTPFPIMNSGITVIDISILSGWAKVRVNNGSLAGSEGYTVRDCIFKNRSDGKLMSAEAQSPQRHPL